MVELIGTWLAIHDRMPPGPATLRVTGTVRCPTGGWTVTLTEHDGPQGINPRDLLIDLVVVAPDGLVPQVITDHEVSLVLETDAEYDSVTVIIVGDDAPGTTIKVEEVS